MLTDEDWIADMWLDARTQADEETRIGLAAFPADCPWSMAQVLDAGFYPD
jgi:hypothetical protein